MKRLAVAAVLAVLSAAMAFGAVQDFGKFTLDVPEGWTASSEGSMALISKPDNTGNFSVTIDDSEGASIKDLAEAFRQEFTKSFEKVGPVEDAGDGDVEWAMQLNGVESHAMLSVDGSQFMLIVATGDVDPEQIGGILATLKLK
ncbi:MAG: hypothetical protein IJS28_11980 [Synergistaceae bacterium]|nr:hypothetical protein [Synergistaceae bacterium]